MPPPHQIDSLLQNYAICQQQKRRWTKKAYRFVVKQSEYDKYLHIDNWNCNGVSMLCNNISKHT